MAKLIVTSRDGEDRVIDGRVGLSVMQILRDNGVEELLALCGGSCSCATCHVYINPSHFSVLPLACESEVDLLESSDHNRPTSRLSCQIVFAEHLEGMKVTVAPEN
jgi:2Fe-2S ferredoxin